MTGGTLDTVSFWVGAGGTGTLDMIGGTITANAFFHVGKGVGGVGTLNLTGGLIDINGFLMRENGSVGTMDITGGTLILNGDHLAKIQGYIDNGWITSHGGSGPLYLDYDKRNAGKTTLTATSFLNPLPVHGSSVSSGAAKLQWTLPEPNEPGGVVDCVVWFGTISSPVEDNAKIVDRQVVESVSVTLAANTTYYWALDLYDSGISTTEPFYLSPIFTFTAENQPPIVDTGDDVAT